MATKEMKLFVTGCVSSENKPPHEVRWTNQPTIVNALQYDVKVIASDTDKFAAAFVLDENEVNYFVVPNTNVDRCIWINGLDGKEYVSECVQLFDSKDLAIECIQSIGNGFVNRGYSKARVFKTVYHPGQESLELRLVEELHKAKR